jgi:hypothetical protein
MNLQVFYLDKLSLEHDQNRRLGVSRRITEVLPQSHIIQKSLHYIDSQHF